MGEVALLFSGQGAQYPGMGQDLYDNSTAAREVYDTLEAMRPGIKALCFSSTAEELRITVNTQPAMFATECAIAAALAEKGLTFSAVAGFSLGEIAALVQAAPGVLQVRRVDLRTTAPGCYQNADGDIRLPRQAIPRLRELQVERLPVERIGH